MRRTLVFEQEKRRVLDFKSEESDFLAGLRGKYVYCRIRFGGGNREKWVSAIACWKHSSGEVNLEEAREYAEETCLGCTMWLDYLKRKRKKSKRKKINFKLKRKRKRMF